jgi:hypothetical protein
MKRIAFLGILVIVLVALAARMGEVQAFTSPLASPVPPGIVKKIDAAYEECEGPNEWACIRDVRCEYGIETDCDREDYAEVQPCPHPLGVYAGLWMGQYPLWEWEINGRMHYCIEGWWE